MEVTVLLNSDATYYCVPAVGREGGIWLTVETFPKPVGPEWRYPNTFGVALIRGRDYVRRFTRMRLTAGRTETLAADAALVADWRTASWWTPGLEEAWAELERLVEALSVLEPARGAAAAEPGLRLADSATHRTRGQSSESASCVQKTEVGAPAHKAVRPAR